MKLFESVPNLGGDERAQKYLKEVSWILEKIKEKIASVVLFGSFAKGEVTRVSDVDLLIVTKDECGPDDIGKIDELLTGLEDKFDYVRAPQTFTEKLIYRVMRRTGMFVSHFICREKDLKKKDFSAIFATERFLTKLLAPTTIVLDDMKKSALVIYGKNLPSNLDRLSIPFTSLIKSLLMNLLTAVSTVLIYPFYKKATEMSMEVIKWSLLAVHNYVTKKSGKISDAIALLERSGFPLSDVLERLEELRKNVMDDPFFIFKAPLVVFMIHANGLKRKRE